MSYWTLKELPESDRPREKLLKFGPDSLSDSELLAILLRTGLKGKNVLDLAREVLKRFGGLEGILKVHVNELVNFKGLGLAKAVTLKASMELGKRAFLRSEPPLINSSLSAFNLLRKYGFYEVEVFGLVTLNGKNAVLGIYEISRGSVNATVVTPKEVFCPAVRDLASSVILFHNHPSGDLSPSSEDLKVTDRLVKSASLLGIEILDHLILGKNGYFSFKEEGVL